MVVSATLVAVTVTVWAEAMEAGAVYVPEDKDPTAGFRDQFTPVLLVPVTVAVNCAVWPPDKVAEPGVTLIAMADVLLTVSDPPAPVIDPDDPSDSASLRLVTCIAEEPLALAATLAVTVATTPLPIGFPFNPATIQVRPLQDKVLPAAEAAGPGWTVKEAIAAGTLNVH